MKPAAVTHDELAKYLTNSQCFSLSEMSIIATSHLQSPEEIKNILYQSIILKKDLKKLLKYPSGIMFVEIGGHVEYNSQKLVFHNTYKRSCWDASSNKPFIEIPITENSKDDWHLHPWNIVGYGKPNFFSHQDVINALTIKKIKYLFVGHPFTYDWPEMFILNTKQK